MYPQLSHFLHPPPAAGIQPSPKEQGVALASFVQAKFPRFPTEAASEIPFRGFSGNRGAQAAGQGPPANSSARAFLKYNSVLGAASRVQGYASWHCARSLTAQLGQLL